MKTVIVGGVAGGASAAARLRRNDEESEIVLFEKGRYISFANCGMPYYIGEEIKDRDELLLNTPESFNARFNVDVRILSEVVEINPKENRVKVVNVETKEEYFETYDNLVLSPGAKPIVPPIEGANLTSVFTLRSINDMDRIKEFIDNERPLKATIIGGGYIGLEMADNLANLGLEVTIVEAALHVINTLDLDMAHQVHNHIRQNDVRLLTNEKAVKFTKNEVVLESGKTIVSDFVILSIGVLPDTTFVKDSGIELGPRGEIIVDDYLRTNFENIYAVGDAIRVKHFIDGSNAIIPLASPANKQGRIVADNICNKNLKYQGTQGTAIARVFGLNIAVTGLSEEFLKRSGVKYLKSITFSGSNASYYPGSESMRVKLMFSEKGNIYGAQIVGGKGVDKRIDVIATAIRAKMTVYDLQELELAYAPPFSSAKDPVNMAGYVAANILEGQSHNFYIEDFEKIPDNAILLDVRTESEFSRGKIENAIKISVDELRDNINLLSKDKPIYLYCRIGQRGYIAERILKQNGFKEVYNLAGGYLLYEEMLKDINI